MPFRPFLLFLPLVPAAILLSSCASVSVTSTEKLIHSAPRRLPEKILVQPFTFDDSQLRVDRSGPALQRFKYELQEKMTRHLVKRLPKYVAPAVPVAATAPLPKGNFWLVKGRFERINQGSRLLRGVVGLGAGGTKLETKVSVYDLSTRPPTCFLVIETTGGSNISPGVIGSSTFFLTGITALYSFANVAEAIRTGVTFDTIRTSREVTASLSEYLYQQGAIPYENAIAPKRPGRIPQGPWPSRPAKKLPKGSISVSPAEES